MSANKILPAMKRVAIAIGLSYVAVAFIMYVIYWTWTDHIPYVSIALWPYTALAWCGLVTPLPI